MAIQDFVSIQNTLKNHNGANWLKKAEIGSSINLKDVAEGSGLGEARSFGEMLMDSLGKVNKMQQDADVAVQKLASGETKNLHETLLAVERADIAFKTMNQVRSKVLDAYKEIMKMQV